MKLAVIALCTAAVIASAPAAFAQGASNNTPGHDIQKVGKKAGHHASSHAPRRRMQANRSKTSYPASAPVEVRDITDIATKGGGGGGGGGY